MKIETPVKNKKGRTSKTTTTTKIFNSPLFMFAFLKLYFINCYSDFSRKLIFSNNNYKNNESNSSFLTDTIMAFLFSNCCSWTMPLILQITIRNKCIYKVQVVNFVTAYKMIVHILYLHLIRQSWLNGTGSATAFSFFLIG